MPVESLTFNEQQCPASISDKTSYWNLTGTSATLLPRCLSNFKAIWWFKLPISRRRDLTRSYDKASYRILKRDRGGCNDKFVVTAACTGGDPHRILRGSQWQSSCHHDDLSISHHCDVMMSQITSLTIVYPTVYSDADQRKHQSSASLAFVRGIHWGPVNSPHKWPVTRKMFLFDDVLMRVDHLLVYWQFTPQEYQPHMHAPFTHRPRPEQLLT